ncbi:MAG: GIY-YIG nuclease family protein [Gammaproteobacteria bacterium]|jgi:putative endonuclease|nr:GIY-YIG nuclease family protein [Gammaproteobacteria bacterium]MBQ0775438.1 GIY-YIG nuclease family protein [Gammaproteobacteria bacterium]|tara:strand:+ start:73646 stop:73945 length:300 start_codon:yes stop_codon:yes gene_type:complete
MNQWFLYIIRAADDTLYTGVTTDVARRFSEHEKGGPQAAKYLRHRQPLTLCYHTAIGDRAQALRAEYRVKKLKRQAKEAMIVQQPDELTLLATLALTQE